MPTAELQRASTYFRSMAKATARTVQMAREDLTDARAAAREGDKTHPLTPDQALAIKCGLEREERLWTQLADEIDAYLAGELGAVDDAGLVDLFTPAPDEEASR